MTNGEVPAKDTVAPPGIDTDPDVCAPSMPHQSSPSLVAAVTTGRASMSDRCTPLPVLDVAASRGNAVVHTGAPVAGSSTARTGEPGVPVTVTIVPSASTSGTLPGVIGADQSACPP